MPGPNLTNAQIIQLSVVEAKQALLDGSLTSKRYVITLLKRIKKLSPGITNDQTKLNAILHLDRVRTLKAANDADRKYRSGNNIRKLEGIPFIVKDNFDVTDMPTTLATNGIRNCIPSSEGPILESLINEGAIIIGKANMAEIGFMVHNANNNFAGVARNPHNLSYITGGSSGGSAAAVAARLVPFSFGNDLAGSIRWPASCCGLLGYRPTQDRWSNLGTSEGVVGAIGDQTQAGSLSRSIDDVILIDSIVTSDETIPVVNNNTLRIGVPREYFYDGLDPQIAAAINNTLVNLTNSGVTVVEVNMDDPTGLLPQSVTPWALLTNYQLFNGPNPAVQAQYDAWANDPLNPFDSTTQAQVDAEVASPDVIFGIGFANSLPTDPATIGFANFLRGQIISLVNNYITTNNLDAFILPVSIVRTPLNPDPTQRSNFGENTLATFVPLIKLPSVNLPVGIDSNGLPMGVDLVGKSNDDRKLLQIVKKLRSSFANIPSPNL